jgi:hypothetical protein
MTESALNRRAFVMMKPAKDRNRQVQLFCSQPILQAKHGVLRLRGAYQTGDSDKAGRCGGYVTLQCRAGA